MKKITLLTSLIASALAQAQTPAQLPSSDVQSGVGYRVKIGEPTEASYLQILSLNNVFPPQDVINMPPESVSQPLFHKQLIANHSDNSTGNVDSEPENGSGRVDSEPENGSGRVNSEPKTDKNEAQAEKGSGRANSEPKTDKTEAQPEKGSGRANLEPQADASTPKAITETDKAENDKTDSRLSGMPLAEQIDIVNAEHPSRAKSIDAAKFDHASNQQVAHASQKLLQQLAIDKENPVVSGVGAVVLLQAIAAGAEGDSRTQIATWLGGDLNADSISALLASGDQSFTQAAAMLIPGMYFERILPAYREEMKKQGFVLVKDLNALNKIVNDATHGKIPTALKSLPPNTRLVLTHALHFSAPWATRFSESATQDLPFLALNPAGKTTNIDVPTMHNGKIRLQTLKQDDVLGVRLPFESNYSLLIAMPTDDQPSLEKLHGASSWLSAHKKELVSQTPQTSDLYLPRWKIQQGHDFINVLKKDQVTAIFDPDMANLSKMGSEKDLYIGVFKQDIQIEINEKGGEAAAVTTAVAMVRSISTTPDQPPIIKIDRPFVYAIIDETSGVEILRGWLQNPADK